MTPIEIIYSLIMGDTDETKGMTIMIVLFSLIGVSIIGLSSGILGSVGIGNFLIIIIIISILLILYLIISIFSLWISGSILGGYASFTEVGITYIIIFWLNVILGFIYNFGTFLNSSYSNFIGILGSIIIISSPVLWFLILIIYYTRLMSIQGFSFFKTLIYFIISGVVILAVLKFSLNIASSILLFFKNSDLIF